MGKRAVNGNGSVILLNVYWMTWTLLMTIGGVVDIAKMQDGFPDNVGMSRDKDSVSINVNLQRRGAEIREWIILEIENDPA